jgi:Trypsin-like peptidase domain
MGQFAQLFLTVTLIIGMRGGRPLQTATGFFYQSGDKIYLVTNRHVVRNESENYYPDSLRLRLHTSSADLTESENLDIPLERDGILLWHVHPNYEKLGIDIAVIELNQDQLIKGHNLKALRKDNYLPSNYVLAPGEDLMVIGFPRALSDEVNNLAIVRNASIASGYGVNYDGKRLFLVDANLQPGTSGSPVFTKIKSTWNDAQGNTNMQTGCYLLGVNSASLSVQLPTGTEAFGLSAIWYAYNIDEIIRGFLTPSATH